MINLPVSIVFVFQKKYKLQQPFVYIFQAECEKQWVAGLNLNGKIDACQRSKVFT